MAKAGPKGLIDVEPLDFSDYPTDRAERRIRFISEYLVLPRGQGANEPFRLQPFQLEIIRGAFADGIRTALVSCPRSSGKTMLAAALALAELFVGPPSPEVLCVASDAKQASHLLKYARGLVLRSPKIRDHVHILADCLKVPETDGILMPLGADPASLHGYDPSLLVIDELHVVPQKTWTAATSMGGKRPAGESLKLAISTPATTTDLDKSVMWSLVQKGRKGGAPSFYFKEYAAPEGCAVDDREAWRIANPALTCPQPFLTEDGLEDALVTLMDEGEFRQLRLGQWVEGVHAWLPFGAWDACAAERPITGQICLGFDGSASGDSTALIGCTLDGHVWVEALFENPGQKGWRVPRAQVDEAVDWAFSKYDVAEMACDPWGWRSELETWAERYGSDRVIEWNTANARRMVPATDRIAQAVAARTMTHDGNPRLAAHVANCVAKRTPQGDLVTKDRRAGTSCIDAAVGAIVAFDRAAYHHRNPAPEYQSWGF